MRTPPTRSLAAILPLACALLAVGCTKGSPTPSNSSSAAAPEPQGPQLRLASDLPSQTVDKVLRDITARASFTAVRVPGLSLGPAVLPVDPAKAIQASAQPAEVPSKADTQAGEADLRWDLEPYGAIAAAARNELLPMPVSAQDVPDLWRDPNGTWVAVGGRAQVLLVNYSLLESHKAPSHLNALVQDWLKGKVALAAPTQGAALAHFSALYAAWKQPEIMEAWLKQLIDNKVQVYADDASVRRAVMEGRAIVGLLGSDEAARAVVSAAPVSIVYPNQRSIGTFIWPTALSRPKNTKHPAEATRMAEMLSSTAIEQLLVAREIGFIPLRPGIPVPPGVQSATNMVVVAVPPAQIVSEIELHRERLKAWVKQAQAQMDAPQEH